MVLVVISVAVALIAGRLRGGRFSHMGDAPIAAGWMLPVAVVAQVLHAITPGRAAAVSLTAISGGALLVFLWRNRYLAGTLLAAVGSALNSAVILANGAMPVSRDAVLAISRHPDEVSSGRHRLLEEGDALPALADTIALPLFRTVVSVGDIVLAAGLALLVMDLMRERSPRGVSP